MKLKSENKLVYLQTDKCTLLGEDSHHEGRENCSPIDIPIHSEEIKQQ